MEIVSDLQSKHPYSGKRIILTSKHEKLKLIKPSFDRYIDCEISEIDLDTDQLGTFSGEIERVSPPRETAIHKARLGMASTGISIGIASEGSIGPDPIVPFVHSNIEYLTLVDDENDLIISETYRTFDITVATITTSPGQDISEFLKKANFPVHGLMVRPNIDDKSNCIKGIIEHTSLLEAIEASSRISPNGFVIIESDLRAIHSPSRQKNISQAANLLAIRVSQLCPQCQTPGWGRVGYEKGLKCLECEQVNSNAIRQEILGCVKCENVEPGKVISTSLDPSKCEYCNP